MRNLLVLCSLSLIAADPCRSGLQPNQRPGPYSALVSVGPQRGTQHCFICESGGRPLVIVFARSLNDPLGKLVHKLDKALAQNKELRSWVTFLGEEHTTFDAKLVNWSKKHATGNVPLGVFEDPTGPPTYLLAREADVTVLLAVKERVVANFAFRPGELNEAAIARILEALPPLVK